MLCVFAGSSDKAVSGIKGGNVSLSCGSEDREIVEIRLYSVLKNIPVCEKKNCSGRVFKEGSCDVVIKDLIYRDAGKHFIYVYYNNDQTEVKRLILEYHLHIHGKVKTDQTINMCFLDVLIMIAMQTSEDSKCHTSHQISRLIDYSMLFSSLFFK